MAVGWPGSPFQLTLAIPAPLIGSAAGARRLARDRPTVGEAQPRGGGLYLLLLPPQDLFRPLVLIPARRRPGGPPRSASAQFHGYMISDCLLA